MASVSDEDALLDDVAMRLKTGDRIVLVHGGGPQIDAALRERGIDSRRVAGLRITDAATLHVTESVLCGTLNKALVRALLSRGVAAVGISGQDAALLVARYSEPIAAMSLGFVGEVESVRPEVLRALLDASFVPVVAPVGVTGDGRTALNINADTAAGAIAGALRADAYVVVTDVARVRLVVDDPDSGIATLTSTETRGLLGGETFAGGMRPKMESALFALARGARTAIIADSLAHALAGNGTTILDG
jgi:acetylglutamate kinase